MAQDIHRREQQKAHSLRIRQKDQEMFNNRVDQMKKEDADDKLK